MVILNAIVEAFVLVIAVSAATIGIVGFMFFLVVMLQAIGAL